MLLKNIAGQGVYLFAYDTTNNVPKTGDAANITGKASKDGGAQASFGTTNPTEIGNGVYWQPLAQGETNANAVAFTWSSTTSGVQIDPLLVLTSGVNLPNVAPATSTAGLVTADYFTAATTIDANVVTWAGQTASVDGNNLPNVNANAINAVLTSSVTAVNANIGTTQPINFSGTGASAYVKSDLEQWIGVAPNALLSGKVDATPDLVRTGTAQAGGATSITLDAGASAINNLYQNQIVRILSGTGKDQTNTIASYVGATKVATTIGAWATNPDATSVFALYSSQGPISATVSGGVNVTQWNGVAVAAPNVAGVPLVDAGYFGGTAGTFTSGKPAVKLAATDVTGNVACDLQTIKTQAVTCALPVTFYAYQGFTDVPNAANGGLTAGYYTPLNTVDANLITIQGQTVTCSAGVTVNTNVGTTQPINFTGTAASALVKGDAVDIAGTAAGSATIGTVTNLTNLPAIPANWLTAAGIAASALNGKGDWNVGKTGYSLTQTFPSNFSALAITVGGAVTVGTNSDKSGYSLTQAFPTNFSTLAIDTNGNAAITSNIKKNQALNGFTFLMTDSTNHSPKTGLTVSATRSIDGGAFAAGTLSAVTEVGNGIYSVNFAAADLNGNVITLRATATGADDALERITTQP